MNETAPMSPKEKVVFATSSAIFIGGMIAISMLIDRMEKKKNSLSKRPETQNLHTVGIGLAPDHQNSR